MTTLLRWFIPQVLFYGLISLMTAVLHARRAFAAVAFAPAVNNLVVVAVFLALPSLSDVDLASPPPFRGAGRRPGALGLGLGTTLGVPPARLFCGRRSRLRDRA